MCMCVGWRGEEDEARKADKMVTATTTTTLPPRHYHHDTTTGQDRTKEGMIHCKSGSATSLSERRWHSHFNS